LLSLLDKAIQWLWVQVALLAVEPAATVILLALPQLKVVEAVVDKVTVQVAMQVQQQVEPAVATLVTVAAQAEQAVVIPMVLLLLVVKVVAVVVLGVTQAQVVLVVMVISNRQQPLVDLVPAVLEVELVVAEAFTEMATVQEQELAAVGLVY
jgi:hypothetical protein